MPRSPMPAVASDEQAIEYLESLSIDKVRGMVRMHGMMDEIMSISESGFVTDDNMEDFRADMIRDIRDGPLR